ncbi:Serine/threonine protein kinase [Tindallia magadiensis]|uniref:Serine/threonine protein kinase n=1 Tax=Tindallia magadiensis TaxID=69895 RepID=A0A1I3GI18_9FIRM|nr:protein kinase [Tindallia magadiensis]SFI23116.1 Serine/threonine protein kinase [Tindallia magadiensis]
MMTNKICFGCMEVTDADPCPHCGYQALEEDGTSLHLPPGTLLREKYQIGKVLGQGGFGITYLARDTLLDMKLAVKEYLPQDLASRKMGEQTISLFSKDAALPFEEGLTRFLDEAKTLAKFDQHPGIVSVHDFFRANDTAYLVMKYIEGITLKQYVQDKGGSLPAEEAIAIMIPVLDALSAVHQVGILHRDISPDNIYMTQTGQVILIDFGAARQTISDKARSMSVLLKPGYTPEEQYRSKGSQGPWTDLYAVGATLYRLITGKMPAESLDRLVEDELTPPSHWGIPIEPHVEKAILKAMAVAGKDRYQQATDLVNDLLKKPAPIDPPSSLTAPVERPASHPSSVSDRRKWVIGAIVLLLAGVGVVMAMGSRTEEPIASIETPAETSTDITEAAMEKEVPEEDSLLTHESTTPPSSTEAHSEATNLPTSREKAPDGYREADPSSSSFSQGIILREETALPEVQTASTEVSYVEEVSRIISSSTLHHAANRYSENHVFDGQHETAWVEGATGDGIDEWIRLDFDHEKPIQGIFIINGYTRSEEIFYNNNRVKDVLIELSNGQQFYTQLADGFKEENHLLFETPINTQWIKLTIKSVYPGSQYQDTCISGIYPYKP